MANIETGIVKWFEVVCKDYGGFKAVAPAKPEKCRGFQTSL